MPTVLIIDSQGTEVERITGFVNAEEFLEMIESVK
jgi:thiol:disulfide interchange protein